MALPNFRRRGFIVRALSLIHFSIVAKSLALAIVRRDFCQDLLMDDPARRVIGFAMLNRGRSFSRMAEATLSWLCLGKRADRQSIS